jgi:DNA mismatch repair protein MutS2
VERESRREARKFLLAARADVEQTIRELRGASAELVDEAAREARRHIEQLAAEQSEGLARLGEGSIAPVEGDAPSGAPNVGDVVEISTLEGRTGLVVELRANDAVVALGDLKMTFPVGALRRSTQQRPAGKVNIPISGDLPEVLASSEIDLRGLRAGDIEEVVLQALDAAIRADLRSLRIIHGKGTGALRERVSEMLRKDTRVRSFRLGAWNEGGSGVTIADL